MKENIARLDIAVDNALFMGIIQCAGERTQQPRHVQGLHSLVIFMQAFEVRGKRGSLYVFHNNVWMPVHDIEVVDLDDVGMAQGCHHPCFPLEAPLHIIHFFDMSVQDLYRHLPLKSKMRAEIDLCHSTIREMLINPDFTDNGVDPLQHGVIIQY